MSQFKKFIMTKDKSVANQLIASGFILLSNICETYTFVNESKGNFNFAEVGIDVTKLVYTDRLAF